VGGMYGGILSIMAVLDNGVPDGVPTLEEIRVLIDNVDSQIVGLLNRRSELSLNVRQWKSSVPGTRWFAPERERDVVERLEARLAETSAVLPLEALAAIYREILSSSRALQKPLTVAYWGPAGTFTHIAATTKFGSSSLFLPSGSIMDVFSAVEHERADFGVIPVENSTEGIVSYTLDTLQLTTLRVCAEVYVPITQNLLSLASNLNAIKRLFTGPQPHAQCRQWLDQHLSQVEVIEVMPTSRSVERAKDDPEGAAIAPALASQIYSVPLLVEHIEDDPRNTTRFLVVGRNDPPATGRDKTSVLFAVRNEPGALARALRAFEDADVNLTLITSRPSKHTPWEYVQFIDMQGHEKQANVQVALNSLKEQSLFVQILGSYPEA
jgi:chorismate mutase / prephenate dehydratase